MKYFEIKALVDILAGIKLCKIPDSDVKGGILMNYLALRKIVKDVEADKQELAMKFQEDWKEERDAVFVLRREKKPIEGHDDYLKAVDETNLILQKMDETEMEVSIKPVNMDKFVASIPGEEINLEQIAILVDCGILEE